MEVEIQRVEQIGDTNYVDFSQLKVRKIDGERKVVGNATFHAILDNSYLASCLVYKKAGGEYRLQPYRLPEMPFCSFLDTDIYGYPELAASSDFPKPVPCPFPNVS